MTALSKFGEFPDAEISTKTSLGFSRLFYCRLNTSSYPKSLAIAVKNSLGKAEQSGQLPPN
jgi:hypothetical protein